MVETVNVSIDFVTMRRASSFLLRKKKKFVYLYY